MENRAAVARSMSREEIETAIDRAYDWGVTHRGNRQAADEPLSLPGLDAGPVDAAEGGGTDGAAARSSGSESPEGSLRTEDIGLDEGQAGIYVQIASLVSQDAAQEEWRRQRERHKEIFEGQQASIQEAKLADGRVFYRLRIGPFAQPKPARELCDALKKRSQPCIVVQR